MRRSSSSTSNEPQLVKVSDLATGGRADNGRIESAGGDSQDEENTFGGGEEVDINRQ